MKTETIKRMFEIDFGTMMGTANDTTLIKEKKQMNNTQQIEEIARILCGADNNYDYDCQHCTLLTSCASMENAVRLYNEGYRKLNVKIDVTTREDFDWVEFAKKYIQHGNDAKIDVWDQLEFRFSDFATYCWEYHHKWQRNKQKENL